MAVEAGFNQDFANWANEQAYVYGNYEPLAQLTDASNALNAALPNQSAYWEPTPRDFLSWSPAQQTAWLQGDYNRQLVASSGASGGELNLTQSGQATEANIIAAYWAGVYGPVGSEEARKGAIAALASLAKATGLDTDASIKWGTTRFASYTNQPLEPLDGGAKTESIVKTQLAGASMGDGAPYVNILGDDLATPPRTPKSNVINPYTVQDPGTAYIRYLAQKQGIGPLGTPGYFAEAQRGGYLADLAPAFGYGIESAAGGQGEDFAPFYERYGGADPAWADIRGRARDIQGALGRSSVAGLTAAKKAMTEGASAGLSPAQLGIPYQTILASKYIDPSDQLEFVRAGLGSQVNPYWRGGLSGDRGLLAQQARELAATQPNTRYLDWAIQNGLI